MQRYGQSRSWRQGQERQHRWDGGRRDWLQFLNAELIWIQCHCHKFSMAIANLPMAKESRYFRHGHRHKYNTNPGHHVRNLTEVPISRDTMATKISSDERASKKRDIMSSSNRGARICELSRPQVTRERLPGAKYP